jgi:Coenzyme PQQ synthesis protein D (PqqD)
MSWRLSEGVRWLHVDDGVVVFAPGSGRFVDLNESAAELWDVLVEGAWAGDVAVDHLVRNHGVERTEAGRIVDGLLGDLERNSVIQATG